MSEATENIESAQQAHESGNKKLALLIAILALFLAITETVSKSYQTEVILKQQEASNWWSFFQAKSIRGFTAQIAKDQLMLLGHSKDPEIQQSIDKLDKTILKYNDDEESGEGKKQLAEKAKEAEKEVKTYIAKYEKMELAAGMLQVAIVLASATIISGVGVLSLVSLGLGAIALSIAGFAFLI